MSMYNLLHGENPLAGMLVGILGIDQPDGKWRSGRFRDIHVRFEEGRPPEIVLYTRNGGGNREHYNDEKEAGPDCDCTGCTMTYHIPKHPNYLRDEDDDFDCTYASVFYSVPAEHESLVKFLYGITKDKRTPNEKWTYLLDKLRNGKSDDPEVAAVVDKLSPLMKQISDSLNSQKK